MSDTATTSTILPDTRYATYETSLSRAIENKDTYDTDHLALGLTEMALAAPKYEEAERYYDGKKGELFSHPRIAQALRNTKDRFKVNFAKTPVNVVADRLAISSVTVSSKKTEDAEDDDPIDNDLTKTFNKEVWIKAHLLKKTRLVHRRASEYGDAYLFVWPRTDEQEDGTHVATNEPQVYYNSPKTTRAIYDPENPDEMLFVIKRWQGTDKRQYAQMTYKDNVVKLRLRKTPNDQTPTDEQLLDPKCWEEIDTQPNPYNRIPVFHFRNDEPYGKPEHYDGYGPQDAINKISTTMVHTTEFMGFPQRFGLAEPNETLGGANPSPDWDEETESTEPENPNQSEMRTGPGTMAIFEGLKEAGTFAPAEAKAFLEPMEFYVRALAQTTTTPLRYFYPPGAHPPSGESYRVEDTPLNNKTKDRQDSYEEPYQDCFAFCMEIVTDIPAEDLIVDVKWAPAASIDDALGWETVQKKIDAGVPRRQALIEAGYTADQVDSWLVQNNDKAEFLRDVEMLSILAAASKNYADAAIARGMNPEAVGILLTHFAQKLLPQDVKKLPLPEPTPPDNPDSREGIEPSPRLDTPPGGLPEHEGASR